MSSVTHNKDDRINLRLKSNTKLLLERAASFEGKTVSKFILNSALERAEKTIQQHNLISLSAHSEAFFNALAGFNVCQYKNRYNARLEFNIA